LSVCQSEPKFWTSELGFNNPELMDDGCLLFILMY